ncbi:MAG: hypothetical protein HYX67_13765 [Candidatus Melainabacteria bacterium]|nr:hypothetical protein [Candidatus Melainabacteria bacterium]
MSVYLESQMSRMPSTSAVLGEIAQIKKELNGLNNPGIDERMNLQDKISVADGKVKQISSMLRMGKTLKVANMPWTDKELATMSTGAFELQQIHHRLFYEKIPNTTSQKDPSIKINVSYPVPTGMKLGYCREPEWEKKPIAFDQSDDGSWRSTIPANKEFKVVLVDSKLNVVSWENFQGNRKIAEKEEGTLLNLVVKF